MLKRFIIVAILCAVVVGALVGFNEVLKPMMIAQFLGAPRPPVTVSAAEVTKETWPSYLQAIGTVTAVEGVDVASQVAGTVSRIAFQPNQQIEAGQVLVQLDDAVEQADLALQESRVRLARQTLDRVSALRARGNASEAAFDEARATLDQAQAALAQTRAVIDEKRIEAPFSGVVGIPKINLGQYVSAGDPLVTLQQLDRVHVDFTLPEQALSQVQMGQRVELEVDAYPGRSFAGAITGIDPRLDSTSRSLSIRATLDNPDKLLMPGVFARVRVVLPERPDVVTVPQTAVTFTLYGNTVFVVEKAQDSDAMVVNQRFVRVGARREGLVEITGGLEPGQTVVTSGQLKLQNGAHVAIDNTLDPARVAGAF